MKKILHHQFTEYRLKIIIIQKFDITECNSLSTWIYIPLEISTEGTSTSVDQTTSKPSLQLSPQSPKTNTQIEINLDLESNCPKRTTNAYSSRYSSTYKDLLFSITILRKDISKFLNTKRSILYSPGLTTEYNLNLAAREEAIRIQNQEENLTKEQIELLEVCLENNETAMVGKYLNLLKENGNTARKYRKKSDAASRARNIPQEETTLTKSK
jgi:hypothetical protein